MCHGNNWSFHCANAGHNKWCYQAQEGCPLNSYENFETMTECQLYIRGKLNKSLECMYHCDVTSNSISSCTQSPQICVQGFHESQPADSIVKYHNHRNFKDIPSITNKSWCRLTDTKWYSSYDNCANGINPVTTPAPSVARDNFHFSPNNINNKNNNIKNNVASKTDRKIDVQSQEFPLIVLTPREFWYMAVWLGSVLVSALLIGYYVLKRKSIS